MKKTILSTIIVGLFLWTPSTLVLAQEKLVINAKQAIAVECETGKILYQKEANQKAPIASLTKILTVYLTLKEIKNGKISWDTPVKMSDYAKELANNPDVSNPSLYKDTFTVKELIDSSMVVSSNSAAISLAETIAGSEPQFVDMMKKQLQTWGIQDYQLVNASGLNNSMLNGHLYPKSKPNDENQLSAKNLAIVASHLISEFPEILAISSQSQLYWGNDVLQNSNHLLPGLSMGRLGVDGLKTGTTGCAGQTYIGTAVQDNMRVIVVILHANNAEQDSEARFVEANKLFDFAFQNFRSITIPKAKPYATKLAIIDGKKKKVAFISHKDFTIVQPKNDDSINYKVIQEKSKTKAPIEKDEKLGRIQFIDSSDYLKKKPSVAIFSFETVKKLSLFEKWFRFN